MPNGEIETFLKRHDLFIWRGVIIGLFALGMYWGDDRYANKKEYMKFTDRILQEMSTTRNTVTDAANKIYLQLDRLNERGEALRDHENRIRAIERKVKFE